MEAKNIPVMESVYARNEENARETNAYLTEHNIYTVNVLGAPGVGKTSSLIRLIPLLKRPAAVIEGDIESDIDTQKLNGLGIQTLQINTGGACHLDAPMILPAARRLSLQPGYLFIENIGNLVCPAEFMIGEHIKMLVCGRTDGGDKPYKYPLAFERADLILVNKCDLSGYVDFDESFFESGVRKLNAEAPVFYVSGKTGGGFDEVAAWITEKAARIINGF